MEHRFIDPKDNFINCIAVCKQRLINCCAFEIISELEGSKLSQIQVNVNSQIPSKDTNSDDGPNQFENVALSEMTNFNSKPNVPLYIQKWIEYNEISSKTIRNES